MLHNNTLRDALRTQRVRPEQPLLSEDEILNTIRSVPVAVTPTATTPPHQRSFDRLRRAFTSPYIRGGMGVMLATAAVVLVYVKLQPDQSVASVQADARPQTVGTTQTVHTSTGDNEAATSPIASADVAQDQSATTSLEVPADVVDVIQGVRMLQLTPTVLEALDLTVNTNAITYNESGLHITIKTSGISAKGTRAATAQYTPRHITMYRNGRSFASWYDSSHATVNDLVPIRLSLTDPHNAMFPAAEVVLWYQPTTSFLATLPNAYRLMLGKELKGADVTDGYIERHTQTPLITQSRIYPNPVHDASATLEYTVSQACHTTTKLVDVNGKVVLTFWSSRYDQGAVISPLTELDALPNGMYLVVVQVDGSTEHIIQRLLIER